MSESCLVEKLAHYIELSANDRQTLARLEESEESYSPRDKVHQAGGVEERLYVVKKGWLHSSYTLKDGRRQIVRIHHPGDIIGLPDLAFSRATMDLTAVNECTLCPFPRRHLDIIFRGHPRLTALLFTISLREQVILVDHLRRMGRMTARERMAHFLLDLIARLRVTNRSMTDTFNLPLNQSEIGDALGLTNITVSKTLMEMRIAKLVRVERSKVTLLEEEQLRRDCDFVDRYRDLDTDWFPQP